MRLRRQLVGLLIVITAGLVGAGCGGSDDLSSGNLAQANDDSGATDDTSAPDTSTGDASDASSGDGSTSDRSGTDFTFADRVYPTGTAHLEISGEEGVTLDFDEGGGFAEGGSVTVAYANDEGSLGVTLGDIAQSAVVLSTEKISGGGEVGVACDVNLTQNDEAGLAGEFSCSGVQLLVLATSRTIEVELQGSFSASVSPGG